MLINGHEQNDTDGLFRQIKDPKARETVLVDFRPVKESKLGELTAKFDIVLGVTVEELEDGTIRGVAKPERETRGPGGPRGPRPPRGPGR